MAKGPQNEASIPNPALKAFGVLVGEWNTVGTHPLVPGTTFHGHASFEWIEGGAFLIMHYFDERGVSRKYGVTLSNNTWNWWRNAPGFSQRFTGTIADDGRTIVGRGELSKEGVKWEGDLALTYTRAQ